VVVAESGRQALQILASDPVIDLVVTDMCMPEMDGEAFVSQAAVFVPRMRYLMLTGQSPRFTETAPSTVLGVRVLLKPCSIEDLKRAIDDTLAA
jgi:DNA-binding NtrC family response regulator